VPPRRYPIAHRVDVSNLELHGAIRISDPSHAGKIKFLEDENATVAHVHHHQGGGST